MLNKLYDMFQNMTKALEALYVLEGIKPVARMSFFEYSLHKIQDFCAENNLYFETSDYKVLMDFKGNYSTRGTKIPLNSPLKGYLFLYLSKSKEKARKAKLLESQNKYYELGKILGYPSCCCSFFIKHKPTEVKKSNDYVIPVIANSSNSPFHFQNNVFGRYFDITLLNHCPCGFDCKKSLNLAKKHLRIIEKYDMGIAAQFSDFLKSIVIYSENGIFMLNNYKTKGKRIFYKDVIATNRNRFYDILNENKYLDVVRKNSFKIKGKKYNMPMLLFE